jgi:undecaprenyl-diphosphatase
MLAAEYASVKFAAKKELGATSWKDGLIVGVFQALALVPGMSRSGMTISGGLFLGLSREAAARFGFLLAVPIIAGSGLKKLIELYSGGELMTLGMPILVKVFYWVVIIGVTFGAFYFLQPYIESVLGLVDQAQESIRTINGALGK